MPKPSLLPSSPPPSTKNCFAGRFCDLLDDELHSFRHSLLLLHERCLKDAYQDAGSGSDMMLQLALKPSGGDGFESDVLTCVSKSVTERWSCLCSGLLQLYPDKGRPRFIEPSNYMALLAPWKQVAADKAKDDCSAWAKSLKDIDPADPTTVAIGTTITDENPTTCSRMMIHPHSNFRLVWSVIGAVLVFFDLITIPLQVFELGPDAKHFFDTTGYVSFSFWLVDLLFSFWTGQEVPTGIDMRFHHSLHVYLRQYFLLDLSIILLDVVIFAAESESGALQIMTLLRTLRLMRFARLLRLARLKKAMSLLTRRFTSVNFWLGMRVVKSLSLILILNHYIALGFLAVGKNVHGAHGSEGAYNWLERLELEDGPFVLQYLTSLHWSLCQFSPSTNNARPVNAWERLYAVVLVLTSMGVFSTFVGAMNAAFTALSTIGASDAKNEALLRQFFSERHMSAELLSNVREYYRKYSATKSKVIEDDVPILKEIPRTYRVLVHREMYLPSVNCLRWLPPQARTEQYDFLLKLCHLAMLEKIAQPFGCIFMPGEMSSGPLMISSGLMVYFSSSESITADQGTEVHAKNWLCEVSLWSEWGHRGSLLSQGTTQYVSLNGITFGELALHNGHDHPPQDKEEVPDVTDLTIEAELGARLRRQADALRGLRNRQSLHGVTPLKFH
eukprot:TRINITY_DN26098_c0_g1_i2.p1 TRINITY_DN26098_c0_g1~~TRINITY_DN26098_c0_g1_i2.p1  ORF type:complete len:672 (+),score=76.76 TRINITY_DN26098_c0_g1_i2:152-2167(+)